MTFVSRLQQSLSSGKFTVTAELGPPRGTDVDAIRSKAVHLKGCVDAVNITDNQTSIVRMSSLAVSRLLLEEGIEPVMQMVCRDRNRIAMQSDILGACALGVRNLLCLTGDHQVFGNQPGAKNVFDIDSLQLLYTVRKMRDDGEFLGGDEIAGEVPIFLGAACNPFADPFEFRVVRLKKKIAAGADFIQTQCVFNIEKFKRFIHLAREEGLLEKVSILAGVIPLKSLGMARFMANRVAGVDIPPELIKRIRSRPKAERAREGIDLCVEQIQQLREMPGIRGIHLMAIEWEHKVPEILKRAGLLPKPAVRETV